MGRYGRTWSWRAAAVISVVVAVSGIAFYDVPELVAGAAASRDPYWIVFGSFASDVAALIAAWGAWRRQVWGVVLLIVVNAFWTVQSTTTLFDPAGGADVAIALVTTALHLTVLWCCLRRHDRRSAPAAPRTA